MSTGIDGPLWRKAFAGLPAEPGIGVHSGQPIRRITPPLHGEWMADTDLEAANTQGKASTRRKANNIFQAMQALKADEAGWNGMPECYPG